MTTTLVTDCTVCQQPLTWRPDGYGWRHQDGGAYMQKCDCGWKGAPYPSHQACPKCGSRRLLDDHCAQPHYGRIRQPDPPA